MSSGEDAGEGASPRGTVLSAVDLSRLTMRPSFMQRPESRAFRQHLRALAHPSFRPGENSRPAVRRFAASRLDQARLALRQLGVAVHHHSLSCKKLVFLQHKRPAARCLRHGLWRWGIGEVKQAAEQREWG